MVLLVTLEAPESQSASILSARLRRLAAKNYGAHVLEFRDDQCPYVRTQRFFDALAAIPRGANVVFSPAPMYTFQGDPTTWLEFSSAHASLLPPHARVALHAMLFLIVDEHDLLDESIGHGPRNRPRRMDCLEDAVDWNEDSVQTARNPSGHPFKALSFVVPVPRYGAATPALLDDVVGRLVSCVERARREIGQSPAASR